MAFGLTNERRVGAAATFVESRQASGQLAFSLDQLLQETGLKKQAAAKQLGRLGPRVVQVSPHQQFFLIVRPEQFVQGAPPVDAWLDDYFRWLGHPYYLALQSAASAYCSSTQAIQITEVMTDAPRRPLTLGRLRLAFYVKRHITRTPTQQLPHAYAPAMVSTPAATAFDLIRYSAQLGGIGRAVETLRPLLPHIRPAQLRGVLSAEDQSATAQRLGFILEKCQALDLAEEIDARLTPRRWLQLSTTAAHSQSRDPIEARWRVIDNSGEFET